MVWLRQAGGGHIDKENFGAAVDGAGNSYFTGRFRDNVTFDTFTLTANGIYDTYVAKLNASENSVDIISVSPVIFCPGSQFDIPFTATGTFNAGNVFTAELSNASGSFASPIQIGTLAGTTSGYIVVTIPSGIAPGTGYRIRVNASDPFVIGNDNGINLTIPPSGVITASATPSAICLGSSVTLTASGVPSNYSWAAGNGLAAQTATVVVATPTTAGTFTYNAYATDSCDNLLTATVSITVWPYPVANTGPDREICANAPTQLGAGPEPGVTYSWSPATGLSDAAIANPVLQIASPTIIPLTYTLTATNNGGCTSTDQVVVTVKPQPQVNAGPAVTLCGGVAGQLQPQNEQPGYSYAWSPSVGLSDPNSFAPGITLANNANLPVSQTYTLTASLNGCSNSSTVQVTVNPRPAGVVTGSVSVCPSVQQVSYWFSGSTGNNALTWGVSGGTIAQQFGPDSITVNWGLSNPNAYVWAIPKNQYNCLGDTLKLPVTISVFLATPTPAGPLSPCTDPTLTQAYSTFNTNGSTYNWGITGGQIVSGNGTSQVQVQWQQPGQGQLWVLQQSITATDTCYGVSDTLAVQLLPMPDSTLAIAGNATLCAGYTGNYSLAGATNSTYNWQLTGGQLISGQGTGTITVQWPTPGTYSLSVTETNSSGCVGRQIGLAVQVNPVPNTVIASSPPGICPGSNTNLSYAVQGLAGSSYNWQITGGELQQGQGSSLVIVNWNSAAPVFSLAVTETTNQGCAGSEISFPVLADNTRLELVRVTVDTTDESRVLVYYQAQDSLNFPQQTIAVQRQTTSGNFSTTGNTTVTGTLFTDAGLQTGQQAFYYRLQGQNLCADELLSSEHATVWLQGQANTQNGLVQLSWTPYIGFGNQPVHYQVWRKLDNAEHYQLLPNLTTTGTTVQATLGPDGFTQCFRIVALAADTRQSWSNSICFSFTNPLLAPNIITPNGDGKNDVLIIDKLHLYPNSELTVLNRWGKEVYRNSNYQNNWGADNLPTGVYFFQLQAPGQPLLKGWLEISR